MPYGDAGFAELLESRDLLLQGHRDRAEQHDFPHSRDIRESFRHPTGCEPEILLATKHEVILFGDLLVARWVIVEPTPLLEIPAFIVIEITVNPIPWEGNQLLIPSTHPVVVRNLMIALLFHIKNGDGVRLGSRFR